MRRLGPWLFASLLVACGGSESGSGSGTGDAGDGGVDGPGPVPGASCEVDDDCQFFACCSCQPVSQAQDCSGLGCPEPPCGGISGVCQDGQCQQQLGNCDPSTVVCRAEPPDCTTMVALVAGDCWSGECVPMENCEPECAGGRCPWLCPQAGDALTLSDPVADGATFEVTETGQRLACTLVLDEEDDTYDCMAAIMALEPMVVSEGLPSAQACNPGAMHTMATGEGRQCTFNCEVLAP